MTKQATRRLANPLAWFGVAVAAGIAITGLDSLHLHRGPLTEGPPSSDIEFILRAVLAAVCAFALVAAIRSYCETNSTAFVSNGIPPGSWQLIGTATLALSSAALVLVSPATFSRLALEDNTVEDATVLFLLAAVVLLTQSLRRSVQGSFESKRPLLLPAGVTTALFLIAGEEISWGQRIFDIATPDFFGANDQAEMNLHNFATSRVENAYYFGAFVFLMLGPMIGASVRRLPDVLRPYVPSPRTAIGSAVAFGFAYDMWDITVTQISFFGSLAVLALWVPRVVDPRTRPLVAFAAASTIFVQCALLINGHAMGRIYDATEYRELFVPIGFFIYAADVWRSFGSQAASPPT